MESAELGFLEFRCRLLDAAQDPRVAGVLVLLEEGAPPPHRCGALARVFDRLRESGKDVAVHGSRLSLPALALAAHADTISIHPRGVVDFRAPRIAMPFFGEQRVSERQADFVAAGDSAAPIVSQLGAAGPDPNLTSAVRSFHEKWSDTLYGLAAPRGSAETLRELASGVGLLGSQLALEGGWVDFVEDADEFLRRSSSEAEAMVMEFADYEPPEGGSSREEGPAVAVLSVDGLLVEGGAASALPWVGAVQGVEPLERAIDAIRADPDVRACIVRVESPGGTVFASDRVWSAIDRLQNDIPVVALLGSQATSGGYYAALACEQIYATPETLTGSINAAAGRVLARDLLSDVGITPVTFGAARGSAPSRWGDLEDYDVERLARQASIDLEAFRERLREGRGFDAVRAQQVSDGRLLNGPEALALDLVDGLGGWADAWTAICDLAELRDVDTIAVRIFPHSEDWWGLVIEGGLLESTRDSIDQVRSLTRERGWFLGPVVQWN